MKQNKGQIALKAVIMAAAVLFLGGCAGKETDAFVFTENKTDQEAVENLPGMGDGGQNTMQMDGLFVPEGTDGESAEKRQVPADMGVCAGSADTRTVYTVHVCGAVVCPGVYELPEGSRVMDAVEAGGGFLEEADPAACNLAQPVTDGCQIYILTTEESSRLERPEAGLCGIRQEAFAGNAGADDTKVNLNTADVSALKTLPGIGDSRAAAILAWREENGGFSCIEDIMKVSGIKQAAFEKIRDRITV